jgi:hypothetical protein
MTSCITKVVLVPLGVHESALSGYILGIVTLETPIRFSSPTQPHAYTKTFQVVLYKKQCLQ